MDCPQLKHYQVSKNWLELGWPSQFYWHLMNPCAEQTNKTLCLRSEGGGPDGLCLLHLNKTAQGKMLHDYGKDLMHGGV
jgi:hypothetical protein